MARDSVSRCAVWIESPTGSKAPGSAEVSARQQQVVIVSVASAVIRFVWDLLFFLTGEGSWRLRPHERMVLEAAIDLLPEQGQALLRSQLKETTFVQRSNKQICRPRFYTRLYHRDRRAIEDPEYAEKTIDVQVDVDGVDEVAQVQFFRGRADSVQFRRPGAYYAGRKLKVRSARPGKVGHSYAAAIDRCEHDAGR